MSEPKCPICNGIKLEGLTSVVGGRLYCRTCFHGWRLDIPQYPYSSVAMCSLGTNQERLQRQIRLFAPFLARDPDILEIGCATGELAAATRETLRVGRYEGIELSPAGEVARGRLDHLYCEPLRSLQDSGRIERKFDAILMSHVLEHVADVRAEVAAMKRQLKPRGLIFLEVPNGAGHRRLPIDDNWSHLHFFSVASLTRLLADQGMNVIATATDVMLDGRYADSLQVVALPHQLPSWKAGFLSDHPLLAGESKIIVWGAGSVAEEILGNFFDREKIDFFVDKSNSQLGTELLGRPVRGPEALGNDPRTIILASIEFAPAIAADIETLYPGRGHRLVPISELF